MIQKMIYLFMLIILLAASPVETLAQTVSASSAVMPESGPISNLMSTITVDTDIDENDGSCSDGDCALRDAILAASWGDTIVFADDYTITLSSTLEINKSINIDGSGQAVTISGNNSIRVVTVKADTFITMENLTITHGKNSIPEIGNSPLGGGIKIEAGAEVTLKNCFVLENTATFFDAGWGDYYGHGGGIYNLGTLYVISSTFDNNVASNSSGYINGAGGAIYNAGTLEVTDSTFTNNTAESGGAIYNRTNAIMMVEGSLISMNTSPCGGAGIKNRSQATVRDSTISDNNIVGNWCEGFGAGIDNNSGRMSIYNSIISGNSGASQNGGGLSNYGYEDNPGILTVIGSSIHNNSAGYNGGGISNWWDARLTVINSEIFSNSASIGGGIFSGPHSNTRLTLINTTIFNNTAEDGGGVYNGSPGYSAAELFMVNTTIANNTATSRGGGYYNWDSANVTLDNVILWDNNAPTDPQISNQSTNRPTISTSDIEGCGSSGSGWDTAMGTDGGGNIDANPLFVDANGADDLIGTEDDNLRLDNSSPAIDAGNNSAVYIDTYDLDIDGDIGERIPYDLDNTARFQDTIVPDTGIGTAPIVDMGAYEHQTSPPTISAITDQTTEEDTPTNAIPFTIGDLETATNSLTVSVDSDNLTLIPLSNISLAGDDASRTISITPSANQHGEALISITVSDGSASTSESFRLTVSSVNDLPEVEAGADQSGSEGDSIQFSGSYFDADENGIQTGIISWDFGDGETSTGNLNPTHIFGDEGVYTVTLTVDDGEGGTASDTLQVTIDENIPPDLAPIADQTIQTGKTLALTATYNDPGVLDTHTAVINWGDGDIDTLELSFGMTSFVFAHTFESVGVYPVIITLTDDDGGADEESFFVTVTLNYQYLPLIVVGDAD